ncbi:hypothetical protein FB45DRAFT_1063953 [Roridomyces roridus]|uniref:F-box domain-containing protein n=1 Tax=Roridomyces roridus TaxID=1738132 RepID=A0AAD7BBP1_9AGAR|nr:hypothetical protein FB45DRAFT_1063953 [Roridomyces roridus]
MHRALAIPEIVRIVSQYTIQKSLPALAGTCRAFCDPALDLLWEEQEMLGNLLRCMPDDLWKHRKDEEDEDEDEDEDEEDEDGMPCLLRPIVPADWDRVLFYNHRVKSFSFDMDEDLQYNFSSTSVLDILRMSFPGSILFPNLRSLQWWSGPKPMHYILLFVAPRLQDLMLT